MKKIAPNFMTPSEAAEVLGVTPYWARKLCLHKRIKATRTRGGWIIEKTEVEKFSKKFTKQTWKL